MIDPLLVYLERRLTGILVHSLLVYGPVEQGQHHLPPLETRYKVLGYLDDCKPPITSMEEFLLVDCLMDPQGAGYIETQHLTSANFFLLGDGRVLWSRKTSFHTLSSLITLTFWDVSCLPTMLPPDVRMEKF